MSKNIIILLDGTSNGIEENRTNVLRLYGTMKKDHKQVVYYDPGVGTFGAEDAAFPFYRKAFEVWGLATGWGLDQNVKEAYKFLMENYDDGQRVGSTNVTPDKIYMFGFSRGAYTARVLAGFINAVGLIAPVNLNLVDYAYKAYKGVSEGHRKMVKVETKDRKEGPLAEVHLFERILNPKRPAIRCLGLFDTVGSVIEIAWNKMRVRRHAFTEENHSVEYIRHALAIDERRTMFKPQLWPVGEEYWGGPYETKSANKKQDVKEVWFTGVHGDIGGGYSEANSKLAKLPLDWMITETKKIGVNYDMETVKEIVLDDKNNNDYAAPDGLAMPNKSMNWGWSIVEFKPRRAKYNPNTKRSSLFGYYIPFFERRCIPDGASIHHSVSERRGTPQDFDQPNIP